MKSSQLQIRVSEEEKKIIRNEARKSGKDISSWVLGQVIPQKHVEFQKLLKELGSSTKGEESYCLANLNDWLTTLTPGEFLRAVQQPPQDIIPPFLLNYITAMIEQAAVIKDVNIPSWANEIAPLAEPYFSSSLSSLRIYLLLNSPVAFKRRNIFIDSSIGDRV